MRRRFLAALTGALLLLLWGGQAARAESEQQQLVDRARVTLTAMLSDHQDFPTLGTLLKDAKGVLVVPNLVKAGFVFGGGGGNGVLLANEGGGSWSYPAFYTLAGASVGLQIGVEDSEVLFILRSRRALEALMQNKVKLGGNASLAIGTIGMGMGAAVTTNAGADIVILSRARGLFGGGGFDGSVLMPRAEWNHAYYSISANPAGIVLDRRFANPGADGLRAVLEHP